MSSLRLFLLGSPRLERDGTPLELHYRKNVALVAYLAVTGQRHAREALVTLLWPEVEPSRARANLRRDLSVLRKALGEVLVVDRETVGLDRGPDPTTGRALWLDVDRFHDLTSAWQAHGHPQAEVCPECLAALSEAVELYQGDFMAGLSLRDSLSFDDWQSFQAGELRRELGSALERLVRGLCALGAYESAIPYARRWLALDPLHEPVHRHLMQLYAQTGQRAAALRQYQECVRVLEAELGLPPSEASTSLYQQIRATPAGGEAPLFPPPLPQHNLPAQSTPFIGRQALLAEIAQRLQHPDCRLLTLVGPGGSGKTRLALEAAAAQLESYAHGVYWVPLAPLRSVDAIVPTVAEAVGFRFSAARGGGAGIEPRQQLLEYLRQKTMLLVLDNYEHLLDGVDLTTDILETAPGLKVLATSRARLKVQAEHLFPVPGMDVPETPPQTPRDAAPSAPLRDARDAMQYSAVKLFLATARRVQPGFELTPGNLADVVRICRLVEGMPLGILLAASWAGMLTSAEIADELAGEIGQGLDLLETDLRDVPARQRSMRAVFDRSWVLLSERAREVFAGLSILRGAFAREAAQQVTGASLRELMALVDRSLLHRAPTGRYEVHELLRGYAEEKLDREPAAGDAARDRHSAYYTAALLGWAADLKGPRQKGALAEMDVEIENARAAWNWATERGQVERLDRALEGLGLFYLQRSRFPEGEAAFRLAADKLAATLYSDRTGPSVAAAKGPVLSAAEGLRVWARVLAWQGLMANNLGPLELADQLARQSLALLQDPALADQDTRAEKAFALSTVGQFTLHRDARAARPLLEESLALYRALGDRWWTAVDLDQLGLSAHVLSSYHEAEQLYRESLAIRQSLGDGWGIASSLQSLGVTHRAQGKHAQAERLFRESLATCQEMDDRGGTADALQEVGITLYELGRFAESHALLEQSLAIYDDLGHRRWWGYTNWYVGEAKVHLGQYEEARALGEMCLTLYRKSGDRTAMGYAHYLLGSVALPGKAYAEAQQALRESAAVHREVGHREVTSWALAVLGYAARGLGQPAQARQRLSEALRTAAETGAFMPLVLALPAVALLLADRGEVERAVELYALACRYPLVAKSRWFEDVAGQQIAALAEGLPPEVVTAARERGRARDPEATVVELLAELSESSE